MTARLLHTSDWHVGKTLKGRPRLAEQQAVLDEIVDIAAREHVDAVLVAGDLYDSAAPTAEAQRVVVKALVALAHTGAKVIVMAGNHDHPTTFDAYRPVMAAAGIEMVGVPRPADAGGLVRFTTAGGQKVEVAVLPFVPMRYVIRAAELVTHSAAENAGLYDEQIRAMLTSLTAPFDDSPDAVHVVMAHLTVTNGTQGGGERPAQTMMEYHVPAGVFGDRPHYVALGHLHRRQTLPAGCPVVYSGAPFAVDFGEQANTNVVVIVDAEPGVPAQFRDVPVTAGRRLRTEHGSVAELIGRAEEFGQDYLRVFVTEAPRAGLREELSAALSNVLEVFIDPAFTQTPARGPRPSGTGAERSSVELFGEYCDATGRGSEAVTALFTQLHEELTTATLTEMAEPAEPGNHPAGPAGPAEGGDS